MYEAHIDNQRYIEQLARIREMHNDAVRGFPWYSQPNDLETEQQFAEFIAATGFTGCLIEDQGLVVAYTSYNTPSLEDVKKRNENLADFISGVSRVQPLVYIQETVVDPNYHRRGFAKELRLTILNDIQSKASTGAFVFTRHRDDNLPIIAISEKTGFQRTGIIEPSHVPDVYNEYWYFISP